MFSWNRVLFLCLALLLWRNANGLGVWRNKPANYWQSGGVSNSFGDAVSSLAQQDFSSTASGGQTAVGDVGSAQPLSTSGSGDSVANVPGFLRQYTISRDQNVLSLLSSFPQSQADRTDLSSVSSGGLSLSPQSTTNQAALGFQNQLVSSPVSSAQSSASQSLASQQSSLNLASPGQATSSLPQRLTASYVFGTQTQPSSPGTVSLSVASDLLTTAQQASSGSQSAAGTLYGQPSNWYSFTLGQTPSQSATASYKPVSQSQSSTSQSSASQSSTLQQSSWQFASSSLGTASVPGIQGQSSSPVTSTLSLASNLPTTSQQASSGSQLAAGTLYGQPSSWYSFTQGQTPSQSVTASYKPVSLPQGSASQSFASQQSSVQFASPSLGSSTLSQSPLSSYVFGTGTQTQPSSPGTVSLSVASDIPTTSQQASSGSQSAVGTLYGQPSSWYSFTLGQTPSQSVTTSYKPVSSSQGSASQTSASQQSSLSSSSQVTTSSQSLPSSYVSGIQAQSSSPVTLTLSLAGSLPTTSQQASSGSQLAGTLYGQPSSWYSFTQGQTPSQSVTASNKPVSLPQGSASQSSASQQSSLGSSTLPQSISASYVLGTQTQPLRPATVSLSVASDLPTTSQQATGSQSAAGTFYGQPSSWFSSTQGQSFQTASQFGASPDRPASSSQGSGSLSSSTFQTPSQFQATPLKPVSPSQGSASQSLTSQQSSLQVTSPSQGVSSQPLTLSGSNVIGTQTQPSRPVTVPPSVASDFPTTSQQASSVSQSTAGTLYGQPSSWFSFTQGQTPSQSVTSSYKPVSLPQGSASQSSASQQSSVQFASPSLGSSTLPQSISASYVLGTQTQSFRPATVSLSVASDLPTTSQQATGSQSAAGTLYGQPSSWFSSTQGQTPSQSVTTSYKPVSLPQGSASQTFASQQSSLQLGSPSLGTASVPAIQVPSSSPVTSTLNLASDLPTTSQAQASYGSQSATGTLYGQASSLYSSTQGPGDQIGSKSAEAPNTLGVAVIGAYTAGPVQWYRVDPFGWTSQTNVLLSPSQASGSQGSQATSSSFPSTSQTQSTTGSSQSAPASTVSLTQSSAQLPTFQGASGFSTSSFSAASPSASVSQSIPSSVVAWSSPSLSTSQTQSASDSTGFGFQSPSVPASTVSLSQSAAQLPSFQAPSGSSSSSFSVASPSASVSQPSQGEQSSWRSSGVSTSFGQISSGPVATTQQFSSGLQGTGFSGTFPSQSAGTSQTSGSYGSTFQSSTTQVGSFDQFSPVSNSVDSTFAQGTPTRFGLLQGYSSQPADFKPATRRGNDFSVKQ